MDNTHPAISAIICTRNRPDLIGQAVASVLGNTFSGFELIIVDQSDTDDTRQALSDVLADERLRYIHTNRVGLSSAYNTGIARATAPILAFTDDDCVVPPDWLEKVHGEFSRHADIGLLYGQVNIPASLRESAGVVPALPIKSPRRISRRTGFFVYGMGANFAARRDLLMRLGGFDEVLGGGGPLRSSQDFDLQYRVYRAGATTYLSPLVQVDHYGHRSDQQWPATLLAYGIGDGAFYMKHARCGDPLATWLLARRFTGQAGRLFAKKLLRRSVSPQYVRGFMEGARGSFRFQIDRTHRRYVASA
jgi:glycosyltransferase involved in cell wall biosynthesis